MPRINCNTYIAPDNFVITLYDSNELHKNPLSLVTTLSNALPQTEIKPRGVTLARNLTVLCCMYSLQVSFSSVICSLNCSHGKHIILAISVSLTSGFAPHCATFHLKLMKSIAPVSISDNKDVNRANLYFFLLFFFFVNQLVLFVGVLRFPNLEFLISYPKFIEAFEGNI